MRTHLRGTFLCARAAAIRMREQGAGRPHHRRRLAGGPVRQLRPDELRGRQGRASWRFARTWALELARAEITVNAIVPTAWTAMTATIPIYKPLVARVAAGEPLPAAGAPRARDRHARGLRRPGRVPRLGRRGRDQRAGDRDRRRPALSLLAPGGDRHRAARRRLGRRRDRGDLAGALRGARAAVRRPTAEAGRSNEHRRRSRSRHRRPHARAGAAARRAGSADDGVPRRGGASTFARTSRARTRRRSPTTTARARWRR